MTTSAGAATPDPADEPPSDGDRACGTASPACAPHRATRSPRRARAGAWLRRRWDNPAQRIVLVLLGLVAFSGVFASAWSFLSEQPRHLLVGTVVVAVTALGGRTGAQRYRRRGQRPGRR